MILCCGEALIDMIPNADGAFVPHAGGAIFNTSIGLGRQGVDVGLLSGVSNDLFGQILDDALVASKVSTDHLIRSDRPTTLAFVKLVNGSASYAFYDENTAGRLLTPEDAPATLPDSVQALFFGGISLAVDPCAETYLDVLRRNAKGRLVMVDPNIRPQFIQNEVRYRTRLDQVLHLADVVKISDEDLDWIDTSDDDLATKAAKIIGMGPSLICVTLGAEGVQLFDASGLVATARPTAVQVVDPVGAGDAFNAGFLTCLANRNALNTAAIEAFDTETLQSILTFASAFATDTVTRAGSDPAWNFSV